MPSTFPKYVRLLQTPEFQRVFACRQSVADACLIVYGARNSHNYSRIGLAVSRKIGNAVVRNRWKRRIREAFRLQQEELPKGWDWVVLPKRNAQPDFEKIHASFASLTRRVARRGRPKQRHEEKKSPQNKRRE